jgi:hypothetical protein
MRRFPHQRDLKSLNFRRSTIGPSACGVVRRQWGKHPACQWTQASGLSVDSSLRLVSGLKPPVCRGINKLEARRHCLDEPSITGHLAMNDFVRHPSSSNCSLPHLIASLLHANRSALSEGPSLHDVKRTERSTRCIFLLANGSLAPILRPLER